MKKFNQVNLFHANVPPHIETSKFIWIANQITGFHMRGNIDMKKVKYLEDLKEIENLNLLQYKNANVAINVYQDKMTNIIEKHASYIIL